VSFAGFGGYLKQPWRRFPFTAALTTFQLRASPTL
jgi:hypothetical protein